MSTTTTTTMMVVIPMLTGMLLWIPLHFYIGLPFWAYAPGILGLRFVYVFVKDGV